MKLITTISICIAVAAVCAAAAAASYADTGNLDGFGPLAATPFSAPVRAPQPVSASQIRDREIAVYVSKGIPRARAAEAVALQHRVMEADVIGKMEAAMGGAFGGAWFEPAAAKFHIGVPSSAGQGAAERTVRHGGLGSDVTLTPVRSSWVELEVVQKQWNRRLADLFAHAQVETALSAQNNAVEVTLGSSVPTSRRAALEREASAATVNVRVNVAAGPQVGGSPAGEKTECGEFKRHEAFCNKPITSGVTITEEKIGTEREVCTGGPLTIPEANVNETYLLTAGHCVTVGAKWYSFYANGEEHEIGKAKSRVWNLGGDYADIPVENAAWKEAGNEPVFAVTAQWKFNAKRSYPVIREGRIGENGATCHDGQTSGGTCGEIKHTSTTWTYGGVMVEGLVEVEGAALVVEKGDSGGPFFFSETNREVLMQGLFVVIAVEGGMENNHRGAFMPLNTVLEALKLELLTKNNENRVKDKEEKEEKEKGKGGTGNGKWEQCAEGSSGTKYSTNQCTTASGSGKDQWSEVTGTEAAVSKGSLLLKDTKTIAGVAEVECYTEAEGVVGPKQSDKINAVKVIGCRAVKVCEAGTAKAEALNLPWQTEAYDTEGKHFDALTGDGSGKPSWKITCKVIKIEKSDTCKLEGAEVLELKNESTAGSLLVKGAFQHKRKAECTEGGKEAGESTGSLATLKTSGAGLRVS